MDAGVLYNVMDQPKYKMVRELTEEEKEKVKEFISIFDSLYEKEMIENNPYLFKKSYRTLWERVILPSVYDAIEIKNKEISDNRKVIAAAHMKIGDINKMLDSKKWK